MAFKWKKLSNIDLSYISYLSFLPIQSNPYVYSISVGPTFLRKVYAKNEVIKPFYKNQHFK